MKLANALSQRSELQMRLSQLENRLYNNALVQEGEQPAEDPAELLAELEEGYKRLENLVAAINRTNNIPDENGVTLSDLLAARDCRKSKIGARRNFLNQASSNVSRHTKSEIKVLSTVNVRALQKELDKEAAELRVLEERIQERNWLTELVEK